MTTRHDADDRLDEVLAELERARQEPAWVPEQERSARRLLRAPDPLDEARWVPSRTAVVLVVICALAAAGVFGARLLLGRHESTPQTTSASHLAVAGKAKVVGKPSPGMGTLAPSAPGSGAVAAAGGPMSIHVVGAVKHPGVVTVPAGSRVEDAVSAAGGLLGADATAINLARPLTDGEQVHVPRPGESVTPSAPTGGAGATVSGLGAAGMGSAPGASAGGAAGLVNLNTADLSALDTLPGVGPVTAQRILDWRQEHGRFSSVDELGEVSGIGDKAMERLRPRVTV